jgi:hypothetical protein
MTDFSVTISESVRSFGGGPTSKWGDTWNAFKWGSNTYNVLHDVEKVLAEAQASIDAITLAWDFQRILFETQSSSDAVTVARDIVLAALGSNDIAMSDVLTSVGRYDGAGYLYTRLNESTYTAVSENNSSWTEAVPNSTTWSN